MDFRLSSVHMWILGSAQTGPGCSLLSPLELHVAEWYRYNLILRICGRIETYEAIKIDAVFWL